MGISFQTIGVIVIGLIVLVVIILRLRRTVKHGGPSCGCGSSGCETVSGSHSRSDGAAASFDSSFDEIVENMNCQNCANAIRKAVGQLEGVSPVDIDLKNKRVSFRYNSKLVNHQQIADLLSDIGFPVAQ